MDVKEPRCKSTYQNRDPQGNKLGPLRRCTATYPHSLHRWLRPGHAVRWPDRAAEENRPGKQSWSTTQMYVEQALKFLRGEPTSTNTLGVIGNLNEAVKYADFAARGI